MISRSKPRIRCVYSTYCTRSYYTKNTTPQYCRTRYHKIVHHTEYHNILICHTIQYCVKSMEGCCENSERCCQEMLESQILPVVSAGAGGQQKHRSVCGALTPHLSTCSQTISGLTLTLTLQRHTNWRVTHFTVTSVNTARSPGEGARYTHTHAGRPSVDQHQPL